VLSKGVKVQGDRIPHVGECGNARLRYGVGKSERVGKSMDVD